MITPRVTRLVRVPDLRAMHAAIARGSASSVGARRCAVIVPTRGAAEELRRTLENLALGERGALLLPDLLTRHDFYDRLHAALPSAPPLLTAPEREVLLRRAARKVEAEGNAPPFTLRAGLILQMLAFYDELRRREQTLDDFSRLATAQLAPSVDIDRGAERLLRQTEFLTAAYWAFEHLTHETGALDEHGLRTLLLDQSTPAGPYTHVIVTVPDISADPRGLYATDFVLLSRLAGVQTIDVVVTEAVLASGFHERLHGLMPGIEEERFGSTSPPATLVVPETSEAAQHWFVLRDREEELAHFVRDLRHRAASPHENVRPAPLDRCAIVFQRPLPYLYLARQVLPDGGIDYEATDALPLSGEPFAAALDVLLTFLIAEGNRSSILELLTSPHFVFSRDVAATSVTALDDWLRDRKYAGGWDRLSVMASSLIPAGDAVSKSEKRRASLAARATPAMNAAVSAATGLAAALTGANASSQLQALLDFIGTHERLPDHDSPRYGRHMRARAAVLAAIHALRDAHARHDDAPLDTVELAGSLRRWIDAQTFAPRTGAGGVRLLDAASASYADIDELRFVGMVEHDWPEPVRRSIFYPASMLSQFGWPADAARGAAARAQFRDLLTLPSRRVTASSFTLEDDAMVAASALLEELDSMGLEIERQPPFPAALAFEHEGVAAGFNTSTDETARAWFELRQSRTPTADPKYHGTAGSRPTRTYAVSSVERYLECPFKYYAAHVLELPEERDEETGLTPIERGQFVHDVFEQFFGEWHRAGGRTITTANVADALAMFERVVEARLPSLPEADRAVERTYLLGSAAASGLGERAFAFEIEQGGDVVERLLEHELVGTFQFTGAQGARSVAIRAKADRIDLMADGTLRVIDYKLSRAPKLSRALQLPIYGVCATQELEGRHGRSWTLTRAGYVAFKEKEAFVPLGGRNGDLAGAIAEGQERFLAAIDGIERGDFPVSPDEPFKCRWCGYAGVCRKDYVGDE